MKVKFLITSIGSTWLTIKKKENTENLSFQSGKRTAYPDKEKSKKETFQMGFPLYPKRTAING